jgi:catechol 2,3-dioxygenase-like lactoylglutathione lyase family enzyme
MKLRTGDPWMPAPEYSRSLRGLSVNIMVRDMERALAFQRGVLGAEIVYSDPDFAVVRGYGGEWTIHADHTFERHPLAATLAAPTPRGLGVEFRVHGCDPDRAAEAATRLGYEVVAGVADKGHGLREVYLRDADGYVWVADVPVS